MDLSALVVGDKSDHGGTIITGDPITLVDGKPIARIGDLHSCPLFYCPENPNSVTNGSQCVPHAVTPIILTAQCPTRMMVNGRPVAVVGDTTGCGARFLPKFSLLACVGIAVSVFSLGALFLRQRYNTNVSLSSPTQTSPSATTDQLISDKLEYYAKLSSKIIGKESPQKPPETPPDKIENCNCD